MNDEITESVNKNIDLNAANVVKALLQTYNV
jgi:hypothetical protein